MFNDEVIYCIVQYFQMVCGLPDEVGGQREHWIGVFVHSDFLEKTDVALLWIYQYIPLFSLKSIFTADGTNFEHLANAFAMQL